MLLKTTRPPGAELPTQPAIMDTSTFVLKAFAVVYSYSALNATFEAYLYSSQKFAYLSPFRSQLDAGAFVHPSITLSVNSPPVLPSHEYWL
jgi:hypothetical protein